MTPDQLRQLADLLHWRVIHTKRPDALGGEHLETRNLAEISMNLLAETTAISDWLAPLHKAPSRERVAGCAAATGHDHCRRAAIRLAVPQVRPTGRRRRDAARLVLGPSLLGRFLPPAFPNSEFSSRTSRGINRAGRRNAPVGVCDAQPNWADFVSPADRPGTPVQPSAPQRQVGTGYQRVRRGIRRPGLAAR